MTKTTKKAEKAQTSRYGRVGTAAEMYRYLIRMERMANDVARSAVASTLGLKAAGGPHYPGWYRAQLARLAA